MQEKDEARRDWIWKVAAAMRGRYRHEDVSDALLSSLYLLSICGPGEQWRLLVNLASSEPQKFRDGARSVARSVPDGPWLPRQEAEWAENALADAVRQVDDFVVGGRLNFDDGSSISAAFEAVIDDVARREGRYSGESTTPLALRRLMVAIASPIAGRVYDPAAGVGGLLVDAARAGLAPDGVAGQEINKRARSIAEMHLRVNGITGRILGGDTLADDQFGEQRADVILATPPFGLKWDPRSGADPADPRWLGMPATRNADLAWLQHCAFHLADGGVAVVALPASSAFESGRDEAARLHLLESGLVGAVIRLPPRVFATTSVPLAVWVLRGTPGRSAPVLLVNASQVGASSDGGLVTFSDGDVARISGLVGAAAPTMYGDGEEQASPEAVWVTLDAVKRRGGALLDPARYVRLPTVEQTDATVDAEPAARLLSRLTLANFKAFRERQVAELAPLTLIYGQNSAGKSSLFHALLMLKQTFESGGSRAIGRGPGSLITQGSHVDLGTFRGAVNRHQVDASMEVGLSYGASRVRSAPGYVPTNFMRHMLWRVARSPNGAPLTQAIEIGIGETLRVAALSHDVAARHDLLTDDDEATFLLSPEDAQALADFIATPEGRLIRARSRQTATSSERPQRVGTVRSEIRRLLQDMNGLGFPLRGELIPSGVGQLDLHIPDPGAVRGGYRQTAARDLGLAVAGPGLDLASILHGLSYLRPLRSPPARFSERSVDARDVGAAGENVASILDRDPELLADVNEWLAALQIPYALRVARLADSDATGTLGDLLSLVLTDKRSGADVSPLDVGFGISQLLPIVVHLLLAQECVTCIEQPEIHVHPRLQAELADLLIEASKEETGNQVIIETHSEHLLLRIQRRIRTGALSPDQVSVLYVDQDETGAGRIRRLRLDDEGGFLDPWPNGFFAERLTELFGGE